MKLAVVCYPTYGGSGVVAAELAQHCAASGDEVHLLSYARPGRLAEDSGVAFHQVAVPDYPLFEYPPYSLALATKIVDVVRRYGVELVHVHYAVPNAISAVLARQMVAPVPLRIVTTLHGTDVTLVGADPSYRETTRYGIRESDHVTAVSRSLRRQTEEQLGLVREIEVIPNFAEIDELPPERGARRFAHGAERLLVHVSNFRPVKRSPDLVDILARVRAQVPCRLLLVGDGPERAAVLERAAAWGLADAVTVLGALPRVEEALCGADVFLLPSQSESFGLAALEAMAAGVPVVASAVGGVPEVVRDGIDGCLCLPGDVEAMAAATLRLLGDPATWQRMAHAARTRAQLEFSAERIVERYRQAYAALLAQV